MLGCLCVFVCVYVLKTMRVMLKNIIINCGPIGSRGTPYGRPTIIPAQVRRGGGGRAARVYAGFPTFMKEIAEAESKGHVVITHLKPN
jgi:hypothetical protein